MQEFFHVYTRLNTPERMHGHECIDTSTHT